MKNLKNMKFYLNNEKNSIQITPKIAEEKDFSVGDSKLGGIPHFPKELALPEYKSHQLMFVAQFNMEEVSKFDKDNILPISGMLYFFHDTGAVWGFDPDDKGGFKVIYYDGNRDNLVPLSTDVDTFNPCKVSFKTESSISTFSQSKANKHDGDNKDEKIEITYVTKLLGHPDLIFEDINIFRECQYASNGINIFEDKNINQSTKDELDKGIDDWILLFQITTIYEADMVWGSEGNMYFCIKKEDLKNKIFENVWVILQSGR